MTKQEEIRERAAKVIYGDWAIGSIPWEKLMEAEKKPWLETADRVLKDEDSQGVVVKVDRELPKLISLTGKASLPEKCAYALGVSDMAEKMAGCVAVEPLIKESD